MKRIAILFAFLALLSCSALKGPGVGTPAHNERGKGIPSQFTDSLRLWGLVNYLASDAMKGRETGSPEIEMAAEFIIKNLKQNKVRPFFSGYRDTLANTKRTAFNIVGVIPGTDPGLRDEYVLIGAHYDHIGIVNRVNGDGIANGANDNASGTATVLELSRYFSRKRSLKRSLIIAFFSAEERGLLGSQHLANQLKEQGIDLYLMLNFEMTGVPLNRKDFLVYITGFSKSNLAEVANAYVKDSLVGFLPTENDYNLFRRSDNYPFYSIYQIPSHTFCTFDFNNYPYYHKAGDEPERLNYGHMAEVINRIIPAVEELVNSRERRVKLK